MKKKNPKKTWEEIVSAAQVLGIDRLKMASLACRLGYSNASSLSGRIAALGKSYSDLIHEVQQLRIEEMICNEFANRTL